MLFSVWGSGFIADSRGFWVEGLGFRIKDSRFRYLVFVHKRLGDHPRESGREAAGGGERERERGRGRERERERGRVRWEN